jgi:hypothetical protein
MVMAKSADEARAQAMKSKRGLPKGGGKGLKGSNLYTPVSKSTIDSIKKAGMTASLKKAATSNDASFVQGVKRMYGAERLAAAKKSAIVKSGSADAARGSMKPSRPVAKSADAARAAATKTSSKPMAKPSGTASKRKPATNPAAKAIVNILSGKGIGNREPKKNK